jgi:hypothetical protein
MFCFIVIDDFKSVPMLLTLFILADRDCAESTTHHSNNAYCISLGWDLIWAQNKGIAGYAMHTKILSPTPSWRKIELIAAVKYSTHVIFF